MAQTLWLAGSNCGVRVRFPIGNTSQVEQISPRIANVGNNASQPSLTTTYVGTRPMWLKIKHLRIQQYPATFSLPYPAAYYLICTPITQHAYLLGDVETWLDPNGTADVDVVNPYALFRHWRNSSWSLSKSCKRDCSRDITRL